MIDEQSRTRLQHTISTYVHTYDGAMPCDPALPLSSVPRRVIAWIHGPNIFQEVLALFQMALVITNRGYKSSSFPLVFNVARAHVVITC